MEENKILDILINFANETIALMRKNLLTVMKGNGGSRKLLQSIQMQVRDGNKVDIIMPYYAKYINEGVKGRSGVKPGAENSPYQFRNKMPPIDVFAGPGGWIAHKGINVRRKGLSKDVKKANRQLAFLIARGIRERGVPGYHFYDFAFDEKYIEVLMNKLKEHFIKEIKIEIKQKN